MDESAPLPDASDTAPAQACPNCGHVVDISAVSGPVAQCENCGTQFFVVEPEAPRELSEEEQAIEEVKESQEQELSALKIRQRVALRRVAYRTRSYFIIGTCACLFLALMLAMALGKDLRDQHHWSFGATVYCLLIFTALNGAARFAARWVQSQREITAELKARELEEAEAARHEPDLSALSDGSQHARNLERMVAEKQEEKAAADVGTNKGLQQESTTEDVSDPWAT
jgi:hypothetical protein